MNEDALLHREQNVLWFGTDYADRESEPDCPCWTDPELAPRGLYCPACTEETER